MPKTILIISADHTGHGHKSITEAICEKLTLQPDVSVHVIDGFSLAGNVGTRVGKMYGTVVKTSEELWRMVYDFSYKNPHIVNEVMQQLIVGKFLKVLKNLNPDLILSVHPSFNGSVLSILKKYNINIPFVTLIADLVSITTLWMDDRASYIICPTMESKYKCLEHGIDESKLVVTGFPIRSRFMNHLSEKVNQQDYATDKPLRCLIMSGGDGVGNMSVIAKTLLKNFNCEVKIIAGRNQALFNKLKNTFEDMPDKVKVYGFVREIQELMLDSDIAITRGSPNSMLECVYCNVPVIITSALPGQEEGNPNYMIKYNLGVICNSLRTLKDIVKDLLYNDAERLNKIKKSQREYLTPDAVDKIVDFLIQIQVPKHKRIPQKRLRVRVKNSKPFRSVRMINIKAKSFRKKHHFLDK